MNWIAALLGLGNHGLSGLLLSALTLLTGACVSTTIDNYRLADSHLQKEESVVILGRRYKSDHETEYDFVTCVGDRLSNGGGHIRVIPEKTFVDSMYPHFETSTAPADVKNLDNLVRIPEVAQKFRDLNVRYFIWLDGFTERVSSQGSISCGLMMGGAGCFGFATWDDAATYEASIWDFKDLVLSGKISAETQGTSYLPAVVVPIPLLARVKANVCKSMAAQIESFFTPAPGSPGQPTYNAGLQSARGVAVSAAGEAERQPGLQEEEPRN